MLMGLHLFLSAGLSLWQATGGIQGIVVDSVGGEPLIRVQVELTGTGYRAVTGVDGRFSFALLPPGDYELKVATVGYRMARQTFTLAEGGSLEFEVILAPGASAQIESVEVRAGPFELARQNSPSERSMTGVETKNLGSVLADDPVRAVQAMPGVSSNDDFDSRLSLRGADYHRIGLYMDDVLLHAPFHMVGGEPATGSLTAVNGDMLDGLALHTGVFPARYGDRTAGVLDIGTREGMRAAPSVRVTASASNAGILAEGPLGRARRGSWMAAARKSYLQYIIRRTAPDASLAFGFSDTQGKLAYDLTPKHHVSLSIIEGISDLDRSADPGKLGSNSVMLSKYHLTVANAGWRYSLGQRLLVTSRVAYLRERFLSRNRDNLSLGGGYYGEWVWHAGATWILPGGGTLDAGWSARRIRDSGFENRYRFNPFVVQFLEDYTGNAWRLGGFAEHSQSVFRGRLHLAAGVRWDRHSVNGVASISPRASLTFAMGRATFVSLGWGHYVQYPELQWLLSKAGSRSLLPERSIQYLVSIERRLGERTRLRAEFYEREDRDLATRPFYEPRLINGVVFNPPANPPIRNSVRGYARGFDVFVQRRSANRLSGWVSYSFSQARLRDGEAGARYPSDQDQKHTVNLFGSWRVSPTVNLSLKGLYGSGFPIPGYFRLVDSQYYLADCRNALRLDSYTRIDARLNKAYVFDRWKLTLFAEVINLLNESNYRFDSYGSHNSKTGRVAVYLDRMFPIIPSVGMVMEFLGR